MARKEKKYHYIYKTTNLINGKYYIGLHSTDNLSDGYMGSGKRLWYSFNKYGKENHKVEILEFLKTRKTLKEREREIVNEELLGDKLCMNIALGGQGGFINEEHRLKFKESNKIGGQKHAKKMLEDKEYREAIIKRVTENIKKAHKEGKIKYDTFTGRKHTEETKKKMSESSKGMGKGQNNSQYGTCWITNEVENKKIMKGDLIPDGWRLGRKIK